MPATESGPRARILVAEDERVVAEDIRDGLIRLDYEVVGVAVAFDEVVAVAARTRPDLILMDIRLQGGGDGIAAAAQIGASQDIPIIYLTAYADREIIDRVARTRPYGYILKPFQERELHGAIQAALSRHALEQKVKERERWLSAVLRSVGDGVMITDAGGRVTFLNPVAEVQTGWMEKEAIGQEAGEVLPLVHETSRQPLEPPTRRSIQGRAVVSLPIECLLRSRDGSTRPVVCTAAPMLDERDQVTGSVLVFQDVAERRRLEEQLRMALKMDAVGKLAGGIAHQFNNLLTVVNGFSDMLLGNLDNQDPSSWVPLREIRKAGERAAELTRQLLAFSRKQIRIPVTLDLNAVVKKLERMLECLAGEDVRLLTYLDPSLGAVHADPGQIEQVLVNLVLNARDAMPRGGELIIGTRNVTLDAEFQRVRPEAQTGPYVLLTVQDTGLGMTPEVRSHLFEPFFTTKEVGEGVGLGLAAVYGIVKQSGGFVYVDSMPDRGASIQIYLPRDTEGRPAPAPASEPVPKGTETILLVEDDPGVRSVVRLGLRSAGYEVLEAANGAAAIELCRNTETPIHLLLTDVVMPEMSGIDLADRIRGLRPGIKVLCMSGHPEHRLSSHGVDRPDLALLTKPFTPSSLNRRIREILDTPPQANPAQ